jgi:Ser/Thr protein kinase RdoA (MazF antagonist)
VYFACNDAFAYDLAICLNAWCFEGDGSFNRTKGQAVADEEHVVGEQVGMDDPARQVPRPAGFEDREVGAFAYDLAICLNAWCFEGDGSFNRTKGQAMIAAYQGVIRAGPSASPGRRAAR